MTLEAIIQGIRTMVDGGFRVTLDVNELDPKTAQELLFLKGKYTKVTIENDGETDFNG